MKVKKTRTHKQLYDVFVFRQYSRPTRGSGVTSRYAFIGLGNPGAKYTFTRHNIGFRVIDAWSNRLKVQTKMISADFQGVMTEISTAEVFLLKPMTFMNRSGRAVVEACRTYSIDVENIVVIYDDVHLPFETLRFRGRGSAGGHNGLASIIETLGTDAFPRQRIGISEPASDVSRIDYVLGDFTKEEEEALPSLINRACEQLLVFVEEDWMMAASRYNG